MKKSLVALSLLSALSLSADADCEPCMSECVSYDPCCEEDPCKQFFVERCQTFVTAEFLYWTVETNALEYSIRSTHANTAPMTYAVGTYKVADYDFCPGFRVALAWYNYPKYWEVTGQYTWFQDSGSDSTSAPTEPNKFLNPTWDVSAVGPFSNASSSINLNYQLGDLFVARVFDPNPHLRMRILGGLTAAYIEQKWKLNYKDVNGEKDKVQNNWRLWAGGIRVGFTADWFWGGQFYFTGRTTVATLLGTYKNTSKYSTNGSFDSLIGDAEYDDHRFAIHSQIILGPSWQLPCECWSIEAFAGYEFNVWLNLHETINVSQLCLNDIPKQTQHSNGLFGTHGLTLRLSVGF